MSIATDIKPDDRIQTDGTVIRAGKRYGCHCDIDVDEQPDGCVLDYGTPADCNFAIFANGRERKSRWTCRNWRVVETSACLPARPAFNFTDAEVASICMSYRHDFGLLDNAEKANLMACARGWIEAIEKELQHRSPSVTL